MKLGLIVRNMGPQSTAETMGACAATAEALAFDEIWVVDHIAIPPDDAEGSNGRYLDPLASLAWLAGRTTRIGIGTAILNLPYRPPLPTAKQVATIQELSGGRLRLGIGAGWMKPEFQALGVDRGQRGKLTDEALDLFSRWFAEDETEANGQPFLFRPRPERPPFFIGGGSEAALRRAARIGDGWMPMGSDPDALAPQVSRLRELEQEAGRGPLEVVAMGGLPLDDPPRAKDQLARLGELGVTRFAIGGRYADADAFRSLAETVRKVTA
jgi:probable F420-dependent oxidoreductase